MDTGGWIQSKGSEVGTISETSDILSWMQRKLQILQSKTPPCLVVELFKFMCYAERDKLCAKSILKRQSTVCISKF